MVQGENAKNADPHNQKMVDFMSVLPAKSDIVPPNELESLPWEVSAVTTLL